MIADEARSANGKVEDYATRGARPHQLRFLPEGLNHDAVTMLRKKLEYQLQR